MTVVCCGKQFKMPISIQSVKNKLSNPFTFSAGTSKSVHVTKYPGSRLLGISKPVYELLCWPAIKHIQVNTRRISFRLADVSCIAVMMDLVYSSSCYHIIRSSLFWLQSTAIATFFRSRRLQLCIYTSSYNFFRPR